MRVVSELSHELVQKVPHVVEKILKINSTAAGSYLVEASRQFQVSFFSISLLFRNKKYFGLDGKFIIIFFLNLILIRSAITVLKAG